MIKMRIEGYAQLEEALRELPKATGRNTLRRAMTKAAAKISEPAKALAPVRTGALKRNINVSAVRFTAGDAGKRAFAEAMASGASRAEAGAAARAANTGGADVTSAVVVVGPDKRPQAITQEFGTRHHPPQPYMRPAWDGGQVAAAEAIRDELATEIEKARARLAKKALKAAKAV